MIRTVINASFRRFYRTARAFDRTHKISLISLKKYLISLSAKSSRNCKVEI